MRGLPTNGDQTALQSLRDLLEQKWWAKCSPRRPLPADIHLPSPEPEQPNHRISLAHQTSPHPALGTISDVYGSDNAAGETLANWFEDR